MRLLTPSRNLMAVAKEWHRTTGLAWCSVLLTSVLVAPPTMATSARVSIKETHKLITS